MIQIGRDYEEQVYLNPDEISSFHEIRGMFSKQTYVLMKNGTKYNFEMTAEEFARLLP